MAGLGIELLPVIIAFIAAALVTELIFIAVTVPITRWIVRRAEATRNQIRVKEEAARAQIRSEAESARESARRESRRRYCEALHHVGAQRRAESEQEEGS